MPILFVPHARREPLLPRRRARRSRSTRRTTFGATGDHAIVLVGRMQKPVLKALDYAIAARHDSHRGGARRRSTTRRRSGSRRTGRSRTSTCRCASCRRRTATSATPLIQYIKSRRAEHGSEVVTVYMPQYIVGHWWETLLHNHKARRIRQKLMLVHGVVDRPRAVAARLVRPHLRPPLAPAARPGPPRRAGAPGAAPADRREPAARLEHVEARPLDCRAWRSTTTCARSSTGSSTRCGDATPRRCWS